MSDANYNPFLKRNEPASPFADEAKPKADEGAAEWAEDAEQEFEEAVSASAAFLPFEYALDANDRFSKWFWSFAPAAAVSAILLTLVISLLVAPLIAPQLDFGVAMLTGAILGAAYGAIHATWRMGKICRAIHIDYDGIRLTYGKQEHVADPRGVDAVMALSGIDFNGEGRGFSNLRSLVLLSGSKAAKISFEPISNERIFRALREVCVHAWAIPSEGGLLPPMELAEHHAERAGIDSLRQLRKYYGQFVMRLAFSAISLIVLLLGGGALAIATMRFKRVLRLNIRLLIFGGGIVIAALSSLRRLPREFAVLRKIKETEKSLAVALGIDFAR